MTAITAEELQAEIAATEARIEADLLRLSTLAPFRELRLDVDAQVDGRLNRPNTVTHFRVRIRANL